MTAGTDYREINARLGRGIYFPGKSKEELEAERVARHKNKTREYVINATPTQMQDFGLAAGDAAVNFGDAALAFETIAQCADAQVFDGFEHGLAAMCRLIGRGLRCLEDGDGDHLLQLGLAMTNSNPELEGKP